LGSSQGQPHAAHPDCYERPGFTIGTLDPLAHVKLLLGHTKLESTVQFGLPDETVDGEPVSGSNSLLTGKITGNFTIIGPFGEIVPVKTQQNQLVAGQFPTK